MNDRERAAHVFAEVGWPAMPCVPDGKEPLTTHGFQDATTSHRQIESWWRRWERANVGIATGAPGPDVLDIDHHGIDASGFAGLNRLKRAGLVPDPSAIVATPSSGIHLYYAGTGQRNGSIAKEHVDYRSAGGYVVAPPSQVDGRAYELVSKSAARNEFDWSAARDLLDPAQKTAIRQLRYEAAKSGEIDHLADFVAQQQHGNRNRGLFWAACRAAEHAVLDDAGVEALVSAALQSGLKGGEREARKTIASALRNTSRPFEPAISREAAS
jgi:hypothetical protein